MTTPQDDFDAILHAAHAIETETSAHALGAAIDADLSLRAKLAALLEESHLTLRAPRARPRAGPERRSVAHRDCHRLSTVGIGSLLFDRSVERLFSSPGLLLLAAAGSAAGNAAGDGRENPGVGRLLVLTAFPALVLGVLDGVGLQAANGVREYGETALGLPVYLLAGFAISSIYVGFRSAMAYHGGFGTARRNRFAGIRGKDLDDQKDEARNRVEVGFAAEALGDVAAQERAIPQLEASVKSLTAAWRSEAESVSWEELEEALHVPSRHPEGHLPQLVPPRRSDRRTALPGPPR